MIFIKRFLLGGAVVLGLIGTIILIALYPEPAGVLYLLGVSYFIGTIIVEKFL